MRPLPTLAAGLLLLSGCLGGYTGGGAKAPACDLPNARFWPAGGKVLSFQAGQPSDILVYFPNATTPERRIGVPERYSSEVEDLAKDGRNSTLLRLSVRPPVSSGSPAANAAAPAFLSFNWTGAGAREGTCIAMAVGGASWPLAPPSQDLVASPGKGTYVHYAGFWTNGTLFGTNIAEIDASAWPRAGWYQYDGADELPVYVYDKDRKEAEPEWVTPKDPSGKPAATYPYTYYTTIEGFNEALKGLSRSSTRVALLAPEKAYTLPGREKHPLYGAALVFFIKIEDIVDRPCPPALSHAQCRTPQSNGRAPLGAPT